MRAYSTATARNAKRFLNGLIKDLPFPLISIQVDGGSEFMAEFEDACSICGYRCTYYRPKDRSTTDALNEPTARRASNSIRSMKAQ